MALGGYMMSTQQITAGDLMAFLVATQTIQRSLAQISLLYGTLVRGTTAGARVFQVNTQLNSVNIFTPKTIQKKEIFLYFKYNLFLLQLSISKGDF